MPNKILGQISTTRISAGISDPNGAARAEVQHTDDGHRPGEVLAAAVTALLGPEDATDAQVRAAAEALAAIS